MPKYAFKCECGKSETKLVSVLITEIPCPSCDSVMVRQMPTLNGPSEVRETVDTHTGTTHRKDQKEMINARQEEYFWTVEVPRKVNSNTYSTQTMLDQGWVYIDDDGKIQIHTKPPHKR